LIREHPLRVHRNDIHVDECDYQILVALRRSGCRRRS
jgi:hypothetical protein